MIDDTIDFEESSLQHRVVVKRHVDEELDEMKRMYDGLDDMLGEVARQIAAGRVERRGRAQSHSMSQSI